MSEMPADNSRKYRSGIGQFEIEPGQSDHEQNIGKIGIADDPQNAVLPAGCYVRCSAPAVWRVMVFAFALNLPAIQLLEQCGLIVGEQIDYV